MASFILHGKKYWFGMAADLTFEQIVEDLDLCGEWSDDYIKLLLYVAQTMKYEYTREDLRQLLPRIHRLPAHRKSLSNDCGVALRVLSKNFQVE